MDSVLERQVTRQEWSTQYLTEELACDPDDALKKYRAVFAAGRGVAWDKAVTFNAQHGIDVTDLESWVRENLT